MIISILLIQWIFISIVIYNFIKLFKWLNHKSRRTEQFDRQHIPYLKSSFLYGNLPEFYANQHQILIKWCKQYANEPYFGFFHADLPVLVVKDPRLVKEILIKNGSKFPNRLKSSIEMEPFKSSILNEEDKIWRHTRRTLTPPFTAHRITMETTKQAINMSVKRLLQSIDRKLSSDDQSSDDPQYLNITEHMNGVTLDVICRLAFNMNDNDVQEPRSELRTMVSQFMNLTSDRTLQYIEYFPILAKILYILFFVFGNGKLMQMIEKKIHEEILKYYQNKLSNHLNNSNQNGSDRKINILDYMIEQKEMGNLNENQLIGNSIVILLAGYETTSTSLTFTLYCLAKFKDWQRKLREQLNRSFQFDQDEADYCQFDSNRLELLDRIWYETLRLYPPVVSFITRRLSKNIDELHLNEFNLMITRDLTIMIPTWILHHDGKYWPNPNAFDPLRESLPIPGHKLDDSTNNNNHHLMAFQAFGSGQRNCIGGNLALSESRAVLAALILNYEIDLCEDQQSKYFNEIDEDTGLLKLTSPTVIIHPLKDIYLSLKKISK